MGLGWGVGRTGIAGDYHMGLGRPAALWIDEC